MRTTLFLAAFLLSTGDANAAEIPVAVWVQMAPEGAAEVRVVTQSQSCPHATIDGADVPMRVRAASDTNYPVLVCALTLGANVKHVAVSGRDLPLPKTAPERILVLGDTGCRIKGSTVQACNDPKAWPFPQVAAQAAKLKPDLVIDVGDYLYRESACPAGNAGCAGSPWGDNWTTWNADFFAPAAPLLAAAPWVIARGNHEECVRAGTGFLRLLGPLDVVEGAPCALHVAPYTVPLGDFDLTVMDNASAVDRDPSDDLVATYEADFASLPRLSTRPEWLVMHHPIWGVVQLKYGMVAGGNATLMKAEDPTGIPSNVELLLAGHIHTFEAMDYDHGLPPQLISGEGGDLLDDAPAELTGQSIGTVKVTNGLSLPGFGFLLLTRVGNIWRIDIFDATGGEKKSCTLAARRLDCP